MQTLASAFAVEEFLDVLGGTVAQERDAKGVEFALGAVKAEAA